MRMNSKFKNKIGLFLMKIGLFSYKGMFCNRCNNNSNYCNYCDNAFTEGLEGFCMGGGKHMCNDCNKKNICVCGNCKNEDSK